jgi:hypothetical protein
MAASTNVASYAHACPCCPHRNEAVKYQIFARNVKGRESAPSEFDFDFVGLVAEK